MFVSPSRAEALGEGGEAREDMQALLLARRQALIIELNALNRYLDLPPVETRKSLGRKKKEKKLDNLY